MTTKPENDTQTQDSEAVAQQQVCSVQRRVRRIVAGRAYTVMDSLITAYERGECEFRGEDGELLVPKVFGRAGDGFHAVFNSPNTDSALA